MVRVMRGSRADRGGGRRSRVSWTALDVRGDRERLPHVTGMAPMVSLWLSFLLLKPRFLEFLSLFYHARSPLLS